MYENTDKRFQVELLQPPNQPDCFIRILNALSQRIGILRGTVVRWITAAPPEDSAGTGETLLPIAAGLWASNSAIRYKRTRFQLPRGCFLKDAIKEADESVLVVCVAEGAESLYRLLLTSGKFVAIQESSSPCEIHLMHFGGASEFLYEVPNQPTERWSCTAAALPVLLQRFPEPLRINVYHHGKAVSADGTRVPYTYVSVSKYPRALLVEGYGSYGISSHRAYPVHWLPWLAKGYALATAAPRGGRENGDAWYDGGRTALRKHTTFADAAAVIAEVQRKFHHTPAATLFYGRSAGGWLAAGIGLFYPHLIRAVYAEVPYLDVLRTTTNPKLPLTQLEYDEFGDPAGRPEEFAALQKLSPVDQVLFGTYPSFLLKTALHDVQVLPYEVLKFAKKLRAGGVAAYVSVDGDGGHFAAPAAAETQQAEDAALLSSLLEFQRRRRTRRRRVHASKGTRRRRTSS